MYNIFILFLLPSSQRRPTQVNEGQRRPMKAHSSQRRPTKANAGPRKPTVANDGQRRPTQANKHSPVLASLLYGARSQFSSFSSSHGKIWPTFQNLLRLNMQYVKVLRIPSSGIAK